MKFNALIPELVVTNLEYTKQFYLSILGFNLNMKESMKNSYFYLMVKVSLCLKKKEFLIQDLDGLKFILTIRIEFGILPPVKKKTLQVVLL